MAELTTGLIENTPVNGIRPTTTFTVKVTNDGTEVATVEIMGFYTGVTSTQSLGKHQGTFLGLHRSLV